MKELNVQENCMKQDSLDKIVKLLRERPQIWDKSDRKHIDENGTTLTTKDRAITLLGYSHYESDYQGIFQC